LAFVGAALLVLVAPCVGLAAEGATVTFQAGVDFREFRSFAIADGNIAVKYRKPEIDNRLFRQRMEDTIRAALVSKGLKEVADQPDITVTYQISDGDFSDVEHRPAVRVPRTGNQEGYNIPVGAAPVLYTEGTLIVDISNAAKTLLWRGTYRDRETKSPALSRNLSLDARKLLAKYPPKSR
jgi:hypothetical protein